MSNRKARCSGAGGFIHLRHLACLGAASAIVALAYTALMPRLAHPAAQAAAKTIPTPTPVPLVAKHVATHPSLPVAVHGQAKKQPQLPDDLQQALYGKNLSFDARLRTIDNLGKTLSPGELKALADYLQTTLPDDGLNVQQRRAFKNDVIFALRSQKTPPQELTGLLAGIYSDKKADPGLRDYAIQHLSEWRWRALQRDPAAAGPIDAALWAAAAETDQPLAGTALLALTRLVADTQMPDHARYAAPYTERLHRAALDLARSETTPLATRITAIGLCARANNPQTAPETAALLTHLLGQAQTPPTLQLAALGTLAQTLPTHPPLDPATRALLESAARSTYPPLQKLASTTLRNHTF